MSRFYLTLPSNSSMDYYPQNTVAQYTTKLNSSIELDGEWEVGLTEISFPINIENVARRECFFKISTSSYPHSNRVKITLPSGHYTTFEEVATALRREQMNRLPRVPPVNDVSVNDVPVYFTYDANVDRVKMLIMEPFCVDFSPALARLMGFRHSTIYCVSPWLAEDKMDFGSTVCSIYVYCDLVEHIPVGDTKAPLLRIVNRKSDGDENVHETYNPVMYVPLQKKCFDSVEINMMTDAGVSVPFNSGKSFVVLEFRRATYKYFMT